MKVRFQVVWSQIKIQLFFNQTIVHDKVVCNENRLVNGNCYLKIQPKSATNLAFLFRREVNWKKMRSVCPKMKLVPDHAPSDPLKEDWFKDFFSNKDKEDKSNEYKLRSPFDDPFFDESKKRRAQMDADSRFFLTCFAVVFGLMFLFIILIICKAVCAEAGCDLNCASCNESESFLLKRNLFKLIFFKLHFLFFFRYNYIRTY